MSPRREFDYDAELERLLQEDRSRQSWAIVHMARSLAEIAHDLHAIRVILHHEFAAAHLKHTRITLMPKTIAPGQTATAHVTATKADGSVFPITSTDTLTLAAATPADVTFG